MIPKSSFTIWRSVSHFIFSSSAVTLTPTIWSHLPFDLSAPRFVLCPHSHLYVPLLATHFLGHLAHLTFPWTASAIQKHSISS
jgi:hypothetical protein